MNNEYVNICVRCGKPRIVVKTWKENGITYSETACEDKECQSILTQELKKKMDRLKLIKENSMKRRSLILQNRRSKKKKT
ncbi:hypothetical protein COY59_04360 [Candidatus Gottesmanbacteria bacterium CG_4_10_14_0_8_um_filter_37_24]|uniref:Uncharacterized protein n=2 Tax=Candidatus Gottesmaniibacteriota TaxID=1752720 RepID=A0A2M7RQE4_9BACT|nr:MAG: hypothetical protein AUJ73_00700 [Candidatus Gottesmanbacteria bacterium CG1_02_37_22]PIP32476.1 MAG: hypothetical protein COX23_04390 [Candidatus Gottesmanbacteria bacterium CG23_combo_of_CG06-09_8_20_14_all_37_19]PIZ02536.1 MAG: hypothetical protein COY59_04360 [Candidatus Gottesmanbacteria bacterium CG_4_10_14_0_8_um_filter_37_24]